VLVIACGALAARNHRAGGGPAAESSGRALPAGDLHNRPAQIPAAVRGGNSCLAAAAMRSRSFVAYGTAAQADCSTMYCARKASNEIPGGALLRILRPDLCSPISPRRPGTFYLTILAASFRAPGDPRIGTGSPPGIVPGPISAITASSSTWRSRLCPGRKAALARLPCAWALRSNIAPRLRVARDRHAQGGGTCKGPTQRGVLPWPR